jgi:hypothetical protein
MRARFGFIAECPSRAKTESPSRAKTERAEPTDRGAAPTGTQPQFGRPEE